MGRFLNVGIIQMRAYEDTVESLKTLEKALDRIMAQYHRPELVVGVECIQCNTPEPIPGPTSDYFASLAKKYGIYFIPGTVYESAPDLPEGMSYNTAPVYNPNGELIEKYRKIAPWYPWEEAAKSGDRCVVFEIPEKNTKVGVQICYDLNYPEISRTEMLMGAEVLVKLTMDPYEIYDINKHVHYTRALENQAFLVCSNCVGNYGAFTMYGHSQVISPEGHLLWEGDQEETIATVTIDLDEVTRCREYGSKFMDHYVQHLKLFNPPQPYAHDLDSAPVYKNLSEPEVNTQQYQERLEKDGVLQMGKRVILDPPVKMYRENLDAFLKAKGFL